VVWLDSQRLKHVFCTGRFACVAMLVTQSVLLAAESADTRD